MAMRQQRDTSSFLLSHHSIRLPSRQPLPLPVLAFQADPTRPRNHSHLIHRKPDPNAPKLLRIIECPRPPAQPAKTIQRNSPQRERQSENKGQGKKLKSQTREKSSLSQVLFKQEMENALRKMSKKQQGETSCDLDRTRLNKSSFKTVKELAHRRKRSTKTQIASPMPIEKWSDFCSSAPYLIVPPAILLKPKPRRIRVESRAASRSMQQMLLGDRGEELRGWAEKEARESGLRLLFWDTDQQGVRSGLERLNHLGEVSQSRPQRHDRRQFRGRLAVYSAVVTQTGRCFLVPVCVFGFHSDLRGAFESHQTVVHARTNAFLVLQDVLHDHAEPLRLVEGVAFLLFPVHLLLTLLPPLFFFLPQQEELTLIVLLLLSQAVDELLRPLGQHLLVSQLDLDYIRLRRGRFAGQGSHGHFDLGLLVAEAELRVGEMLQSSFERVSSMKFVFGVER